MTKDETKAAIDVMMAWVRGEEIECAMSGSSAWRIMKEPDWNWGAFDFRIKPEPMEIEVWVRGGDEKLVTNVDLSHVGWAKKRFREIL